LTEFLACHNPHFELPRSQTRTALVLGFDLARWILSANLARNRKN
jgi:hypothetical protein